MQIGALVAYVSKPSFFYPKENRVSTLDIHREMKVSASKSPYLERVLGMDVGVEERYFVAPLDVMATPGTLENRNVIALPVIKRLGVRACLDAMERAGLRPADIDCIIVSNSTLHALPGLDVYFQNELNLRPDIKRMPFTQLGCVGGAHTLDWASTLADAYPGMRILVVIPEALSTVYQVEDLELDDLLWRLLFGDSAAACIVSSPRTPNAPPPRNSCLQTHGSWQYLVRGSMGTYELKTRSDGDHFLSKRGAQKAVRELEKPLWNWLRTAGPDWRPETVIAHTGGPAVLRNLAKVLGFPEEPDHPLNPLAQAWETLRRFGNLGGVSVLRTLLETAELSPRPGSETLLFAIGPGVTSAAVRGIMLDPNDFAAVA
ncbi:hypothetical protein [Streptomyces sp. NPDC015125]|uniref:hypothetical protein n=1 Tax=Streptomyces sp. NPDC015125 TaxID=3364938 RepID=UPI0036FD2BEC